MAKTKTKSLKKALKNRKKKKLPASKEAKSFSVFEDLNSKTAKGKKSTKKSTKKAENKSRHKSLKSEKDKKQKKSVVTDPVANSKKSGTSGDRKERSSNSKTGISVKQLNLMTEMNSADTKTEKPAEPAKPISLPLKVMSLSKAEKRPYANTDAKGWRNLVAKASSDQTIRKQVINRATSSQNKKAELKSASLPETSRKQLSIASTFLSVAFGISVLMGLVMAFLPAGMDAVAAIGGVLSARVPQETGQIVFLLDTLFPIAYGAGFAFLANAFQTRGNRPVIRLFLTALLVVVMADFAENALVFRAFAEGETSSMQWVLTVLKFSTLAVCAALLSAIIMQGTLLGRATTLFLRYVFPISIALLLSSIGGRMMSNIILAMFPLGLLLLAIYALNKRQNPA